MNWNGGTLPRASKNAKTSLSTVQKRHFAKARGKLQNGRTPLSGFDFSIFEDVKHGDSTPHKADSGTGSRYRDHQTQRTRDEAGNVAAHATLPSSINSRYRNHSSRRSPLIRGESRNEKLNQATPPARVHSSPRPSSASTLRSAAPGIRRTGSEAPRVLAADNLEARRQELLCTRDWVGLDSTKPVHIEFTEVEDRDLIGKRRHVKKRDHEGENGGGSKRLKTVYGHKKLSTPLHALHGSSSPENISIRIGSAQSRSKRGRPRYSCVPSQDHNSVTSEEMLLAQEVSETPMNYEQTGAHVYSQRCHQPELAAHEQDVYRISPARIPMSPALRSRSISELARSHHEELMANLPPEILASAQGDPHTTPVGQSSRSSRSALLGENSGIRLVFNHSPCTVYRNKDFSEPTYVYTPTASFNSYNPAAVVSATPDMAKRYAGVAMNPEPVMQGLAHEVSPLISATLLEVASKESTSARESDLEAIAAKRLGHLDVSEAQLGGIVAVEKLDSTAVEDKQEMNSDHGTKPEKYLYMLPQDEETVWRDFVFGHDDGNTTEAVDIAAKPMPSTTWDHDGSSMIAEIDFQEALVPKSDSLGTESLVVIEGFQHSSAGSPTSHDLPSNLAEASSTPAKVPQVTSESSSDDPLAWTPGRFDKPKIIFRKPSKYLGGQDGIPASICIGHNPRRDTLGGGRTSRRKEPSKEKGRESEMAMVLEDEIEDD